MKQRNNIGKQRRRLSLEAKALLKETGQQVNNTNGTIKGRACGQMMSLMEVPQAGRLWDTLELIESLGIGLELSLDECGRLSERELPRAKRMLESALNAFKNEDQIVPKAKSFGDDLDHLWAMCLRIIDPGRHPWRSDLLLRRPLLGVNQESLLLVFALTQLDKATAQLIGLARRHKKRPEDIDAVLAKVDAYLDCATKGADLADQKRLRRKALLSDLSSKARKHRETPIGKAGKVAMPRVPLGAAPTKRT